MRLFVAGTATAALLALATPVPLLWAHARLTRADPAPNGHTAVVPTRLRLWFSESPEIAFTQVTLSDSARHAIKLGKVERGDTKLEVRAAVAGALHPGRYTVNWRTAAADGHPTSGAFTFTIDTRPK